MSEQNSSDNSTPTGNILQLPEEYSKQLIQSVFMKDNNFMVFYNRLSEEGINIIAERARIYVYMPPPDFITAEQSSPVLLAILPGFSKFEIKNDSHKAASITSIAYENKVGLVYATKTIVGHKPFQTESFIIMELDNDKRIIEKTISREDLGKRDEEIAKLVGPFNIPEKFRGIPSLSQKDIQDLAEKVYRETVRDSYQKGMYTSEAINSLLNDSPLVRKWSLVENIRSSLSFSNTTWVGGTSSSTSCNGCSSTSTSAVPT